MTALGSPHVHFRQVDSTNDRARMFARAGAPHGTLVSADEQTAGHGRQGRRWFATARSSVLCSLVLREPEIALPISLVPLAAALAVCELPGPAMQIKWPNDVVLAEGDRLAKLAGILIEARPQEHWMVLGIGVNVCVKTEQMPAELQGSLAELGWRAEEIERLLEALIGALEFWLAQSASSILDGFAQRDALYGRHVRWQKQQGKALGIDGAGHLLVESLDGQRHRLDAGEVHLDY